MTVTIQGAVVTTIARLTGRGAADISETDDLVDDLGIDSVMTVDLLSRIEEELGVMLPEGSEGSLVGIWTVGELVGRLTMLLGDSVHSANEIR